MSSEHYEYSKTEGIQLSYISMALHTLDEDKTKPFGDRPSKNTVITEHANTISGFYNNKKPIPSGFFEQVFKDVQAVLNQSEDDIKKELQLVERYKGRGVIREEALPAFLRYYSQNSLFSGADKPGRISETTNYKLNEIANKEAGAVRKHVLNQLIKNNKRER